MGANWAHQLYGDDAAFERARGRSRSRRAVVREDNAGPGSAPTVDEGAARRTLRDQIAKLERELAALFVSAYPRGELDWQVSSPGGPRLLDVGDLEALRDELAGARRGRPAASLRARADVEQAGREHIEALVADPGSHKWERVSNDDIGEPGCKYWHSTPAARPGRHADGLVASEDLIGLPIAMPGHRWGRRADDPQRRRPGLPARQEPVRAGRRHDDPDRQDDRVGDPPALPLRGRVHVAVPVRAAPLLVPASDLHGRLRLRRPGPAGGQLPDPVRRARPPRAASSCWPRSASSPPGWTR